jgi:uncharacterized protein YtpQ (UPF0354 family)
MLALAWYTWVFLGLWIVIGMLWIARRSFCKSVRRQFIAALKKRHPEAVVVRESNSQLDIQIGDHGNMTMNLHNLYAQVANHASGGTDEGRQEVFQRMLAALDEAIRGADESLSLETHGDRIMPRLVPPDFLEELLAQRQVPFMPWDEVGLVVVYVLDGEHSVSYVTNEQMDEFGLELEPLHERALLNLNKVFPAKTVRDVLEKNQITMVKAGDTYDAARLLLVQQHLETGEEIAALIPDRDTLALMPVPPNEDWSSLAELARTPGSDKILLQVPLRVTAKQIEVVPMG